MRQYAPCFVPCLYISASLLCKQQTMAPNTVCLSICHKFRMVARARVLTPPEATTCVWCRAHHHRRFINIYTHCLCSCVPCRRTYGASVLPDNSHSKVTEASVTCRILRISLCSCKDQCCSSATSKCLPLNRAHARERKRFHAKGYERVF